MLRRPLFVAFCIVLFAGLVFPFLLRRAFAQNGYKLADSAAVQRLPDRQGGLLGMKTAAPQTIVLPDGTNIVVYLVEEIDWRERPPFKVGDVLYAVNGVLFTSLDGMPRYVQSLVPGSTATVEYIQAPPGRWRGRTVPMEQKPSVLATVEIFSTSSRYACPSCPKPPPKTAAEEFKAMLPYRVAGFTLGTAIQAGLNLLGIGPDVAFPLIINQPPPPDTGLKPAERSLQDSIDKR